MIGVRIALLLLFAAPCAAAGTSEPYAWPLELPRILTSSFGEYRAGRFHAGIDLRTGPPGQPVYAADNGYVSRLRCTPWGYGKALYLHLCDGRTAVYAHLDGFIPELTAYVRTAQHRQESYSVDVQPPAGRFPIQRGQLIAYAGESGTGVPHLHYELRNTAQHPLNPGPLGVQWPDDIRPTIRAVALVPLDAESRVDADYRPYVANARRQRTGSYTTEPVRVKGRIGLALDCIDPANNGATRLGIYRAEVWMGGQRQATVQFDRLTYPAMRHGAAAWNPYVEEEGRFLSLWRWPGNDAPPYAAAGEGIAIPGDVPELEIRIQDFAGNNARLVVPLDREEGLPIPLPQVPTPTHKGTVSARFTGQTFVATAWFPGPEPVDPKTGEGAPLFRAGKRTFRWVASPENIAGTTGQVHIVHPRLDAPPLRFAVFERGQAATCVLGDVAIQSKPDSPYGALVVWTRTGSPPPDSRFKALGPVYEIEPTEAAIDEAIELGFPLPEGGMPPRAAVYRRGGSGWSRYETRQAEGRLWIATRTLGTYAVLQDPTPPRVEWIAPAEGAVVANRARIALRVEDAAGGIEGYRLTANGNWLLAAYDPESGMVTWLQDADLPSGHVELRFTATDDAGNTTVLTRRIRAAR